MKVLGVFLADCKFLNPLIQTLKLIHKVAVGQLLYKYAEKVVGSINTIPREFSNKKKMMLIIWKIDRRLYRLIYFILGKRMPKHNRKIKLC